MRKVKTVNKRRRSESAVNISEMTFPELARNAPPAAMRDKEINQVAAKGGINIEGRNPDNHKEYNAESKDYFIALGTRTEIEATLLILGKHVDLQSSIRIDHVDRKDVRAYPIVLALTCLTGRLKIISLIDGVVAKQPGSPKTNVNATAVKKLVAAAQKMGKAVTGIKAAPDGSVTVSVEESSPADHHALNPFDVVLK